MWAGPRRIAARADRANRLAGLDVAAEPERVHVRPKIPDTVYAPECELLATYRTLFLVQVPVHRGNDGIAVSAEHVNTFMGPTVGLDPSPVV